MEQGHEEHAAMNRKHYGMLLLNVAISAGVMYFVMFSMIWSTDRFFNNLNLVYMALLIPHHSGAILMCSRASLKDAEIRDICFKSNGIIDSQTREIRRMEAILARKLGHGEGSGE